MPAPALRALALKRAISNVDDIEYVPEVPYETIRPLLRVVKTADQMHKIEISSPHIVGENADIWKALIRRDTDIDYKDIPEPTDATKWWKVHRKLMREREAKYERSAAALKLAMDKHKADKESYSTETLSQRVAKLPTQSYGGARSSRSKPASGSGFLSRMREHSKEKATLRRTAGVLQHRPPTIGKMGYAPKGLSDKLPEARRFSQITTPPSAATTRSAPSRASRHAQPPETLVSRSSNSSLSGKRQLAPSSTVFGPSKKRY